MKLEILPEEFKEKLAHKSIAAIDIREAWEHDETNIGIDNISLYEIPHRLDELDQFKLEPLVVVCRTGARGVQAQKYLSKHGFSWVVNLKGGIEAYLNLA